MKFQQNASMQGVQFETVCSMALTMGGWDIVDRHFEFADVGIDVDIIANNKHGIAFTFSCAGSWNTNRPGLERTDTMKKKICDAYLQSLSIEADRFPPVILLTTHIPSNGRAAAMLASVGRNVILDVLTPQDTKRLLAFCNMTEEAIAQLINMR